MLELVRLEVANFRSFVEASFSPLGVGQGITAINGPNGSGKSSLATHAIVWALFGVTPDGVPVRAMRRQGSVDEVSASVAFRHDGQEIVVTRSLKGKNDTTIASISVDGIEQTNISARTAASWVTRRLGIDAEGFMTAFVVRQKELDALVKARPAERRALVERLAGIDHMSAALAKAREQARRAQTMLDALGDDPPVETLEEHVRDARETLADTEEKAANAQAELDAATLAYEAAVARLEEMESLDRKLERDEQEVSHLREKLDRLEQEVVSLENDSQHAELLPDAQAEYDRLSDELRACELDAKAADPAIAQCGRDNAEAAAAEAALSKVRNAYRQTIDQVETLREELSSLASEVDVTALERELDALNEQIGGMATEVERLETSLALLRDSSPQSAASCPTCKGVLKNPEELLREMEEEQHTVRHRLEDANAQRSELAARLADERTRRTARQRCKALLEGQETSLAESVARLAEAEERFHVAQAKAEDSAEEAHDAARRSERAAKAIPALKEKVALAGAAIRKAEAGVSAQERLVVARGALEKVRADLQGKQESLDETLKLHGRPDIALLKDVSRQRKTEVDAAFQSVSGLKVDYAMAERGLQDAERALREALAVRDSRDRAQRALEHDQALAEALDEFRRDRVARLAPELSEVASDLIQVMMEGKYSSVDLDEDFTPILTEAESGIERPSAWLSGGEESSVALALRIAIGEVVSGQSGGLLVLDEVLTAQDQLRRSATMGAIRSLTRQAIVINHVSEATDMVDLVVQVKPDGSNGSSIDHQAGEHEEVDLSRIEELAV